MQCNFYHWHQAARATKPKFDQDLRHNIFSLNKPCSEPLGHNLAAEVAGVTETASAGVAGSGLGVWGF